jgi:hypothetical protein
MVAEHRVNRETRPPKEVRGDFGLSQGSMIRDIARHDQEVGLLVQVREFFAHLLRQVPSNMQITDSRDPDHAVPYPFRSGRPREWRITEGDNVVDPLTSLPQDDHPSK